MRAMNSVDDGSEIPESRVLIIMTGGTICMDYAKDVGYVPSRGFLKTALGPRPSFNDGSYPEPLEIVPDDDSTIAAAAVLSSAANILPTSAPMSYAHLKKPAHSLRTPPSIYGSCVRYAVLEFRELLDSSSIDSRGWTQIARTVQRNYELFDGFVILHGTDSLAYTSSALSFILQNLGKPVVLTGSQLPMRQLQSDATDNLLGSLVVAGHFMIPEVCLFFNNKLFRGNRTTKVSATDFAAFESPNCAPLATIESTCTKLNWDTILRPRTLQPFRIHDSNLDTAHVACLRIFPGIKPAMVDAVLQLPTLKGLVLETFGAGNAPGGPDSALTSVIAAAIRRGIIIVSVTQCLHGSVNPLYASGTTLSRVGVVSGNDMTSEAALTKLAYLLALPKDKGDSAKSDADPKWVARLMASSMRGELTEIVPTVFQHPADILNSDRAGADEQDLSELRTKLAATFPSQGMLEPRIARLTKLGYAISEGDLDGVKEVLAFEGGRNECLVNDADYSGNTPLHLAATSPNPNSHIMHALLQRGASVHLRSQRSSNRNNNFRNEAKNEASHGHTPLFLSASNGLAEHVRLLREAGAHLYPGEWAEAIKEATAGARTESAEGETEQQRRKAIWTEAGLEI